MRTADLLMDAFDRVSQTVHGLVQGLSQEQLAYRIDPEANSIAWLVWHLTRVQDDHVADAAGIGQVWTTQGWVDRFALPIRPTDIGYGHHSDQVATLANASAELLIGYFEAVHDQTIQYVSGLTDRDLDRVVDERWDPPVSLGVRLISVISDDLQHAGQAAFVRGVVLRRG